MEDSDVTYLFRSYLGRDPTHQEIYNHSHKQYRVLKAELSNCKERREYMERIHGVPYEQIDIPKEKENEYKKIKIALLISGHVRKYDVLQHLDEYCKTYDVDVFIFTWDNLGIKGKETDLEDSTNVPLIESIVRSFPNVKAYKIENNKEYIQLIQEETSKVPYFNLSSPEVYIKSQLYSVYSAYQMMEKYANDNNIEYEVVMKLRFDLKFVKFDINPRLVDELNDFDIIFVPNKDIGHDHPDYLTSCWACDKMYYEHDYRRVHIFEHSSIICDTFAYGSQKSMKDYCSLHLHYDKMNKDFYEENVKSLQKNPNIQYKLNGNVYNINWDHRGHIDTMYYFYCSYPERMLQKHLSDYMLVRSEHVKLRFQR